MVCFSRSACHGRSYIGRRDVSFNQLDRITGTRVKTLSVLLPQLRERLIAIKRHQRSSTRATVVVGAMRLSAVFALLAVEVTSMRIQPRSAQIVATSAAAAILIGMPSAALADFDMVDCETQYPNSVCLARSGSYAANAKNTLRQARVKSCEAERELVKQNNNQIPAGVAPATVGLSKDAEPANCVGYPTYQLARPFPQDPSLPKIY